MLLRQGLAALLREGGYDVVGQASDADGLIELVRKEQPDIAIVDIRMPPTHTTEGLEAARTIREELPQVAILVLSAHIEVEHAMDLLGAGRGIGYVLKSRVGDVDELCDTLERIRSGGSVVDPALVEELVRARRARDPLEGLTARERDVLALMAEGRSNTGIARDPLDRRGHRREAREEHLPEAAAPGRAGRSPPRSGRDRVSRFEVGRRPTGSGR